MTPHFFSWEPLAVEIPRKLASLTTPLDALLGALLRDLETPGTDASAVAAAGDALQESVAAGGDPDYARHAVRVAASLLRTRPGSPSWLLVLALAHNVQEVDNFGPLRKLLQPSQLEALATLTIDRAQERDPAYLLSYYADIASSADLLVLKACDKMDNFLSYVIYDVDDYHFDVVARHVCPSLDDVNSRLSSYLQEVLATVGRPGIKARYAADRAALEART